MMKRKLNLFLFFLFVSILLSCNSSNSSTFDFSKVAVSWELIENDLTGKMGSTAAFTITNQSNISIPAQDWTMYFSQLPRNFIPESIMGNVKIEQINGDYFKLYPAENFQAIAPNESRRIEFNTTMWVIKKAGAPNGLYFVQGDKEPIAVEDFTIVPFTEQQLQRNKDDKFPVPTAEFRFAQNTKLTKTEPAPVIPSPVNYKKQNGETYIQKDWVIHYEEGLSGEAQHLAKALEPILRSKLKTAESNSSTTKSILLKISQAPIKGKIKEAYRLNIDGNITITGTDAAGVFYGIQSLKGLIPAEYLAKAQADIKLNNTTIEDYPRFEYRGLHLDVSRNFIKKEDVIKLLEAMSFYKLNKFHFHITDDEGWRLEIEDLPELTEVGGRRGHTLDEKDRLFPAYGSGPFSDFPGSGFYTKADFIEILKYANERHIEVIPEIDVPGHARAAIKAMDVRYEKLKAENHSAFAKYLLRELDDQSEYSSAQAYNDNVICVCQESTYDFLEKVVNEVVKLFEEAEVPLTTIHTGGDEVPNGSWTKSPLCQKLIAETASLNSAKDLFPYFVGRFNEILSKRNLITGGWEEVGMHTVERDGKMVHEPNPALANRNVMPYFWNSIFGWGNEDVGYQLANAGYDVVMCSASNLYFDLSYDKDPEESGLYWAGFVNTRSSYEFIPFDLFKAADMGRFGDILNPDEVSKGKTKLTAEGRKHIVGMQGQLWSETVKSGEMMEQYIFPKIFGMAERAWASPPTWEEVTDTDTRRAALDNGWNQFANTLGQQEMPRLDFLAGGINYRIPPAGAKIENDQLMANTAFPGLDIRYTTDGSEPTMESPIYEKPLPANQQIKLKVFSPNGHSSRTVALGEDQLIK